MNPRRTRAGIHRSRGFSGEFSRFVDVGYMYPVVTVDVCQSIDQSIEDPGIGECIHQDCRVPLGRRRGRGGVLISCMSYS